MRAPRCYTSLLPDPIPGQPSAHRRQGRRETSATRLLRAEDGARRGGRIGGPYGFLIPGTEHIEAAGLLHGLAHLRRDGLEAHLEHVQDRLPRLP